MCKFEVYSGPSFSIITVSLFKSCKCWNSCEKVLNRYLKGNETKIIKEKDGKVSERREVSNLSLSVWNTAICLRYFTPILCESMILRGLIWFERTLFELLSNKEVARLYYHQKIFYIQNFVSSYKSVHSLHT